MAVKLNIRFKTAERPLLRRFSIAGSVAVFAIAAGAASVGQSGSSARLTPREADLVLIPAGETMVGDDDGMQDEAPAFLSRSPSLYFDRTPVTVRQFGRFVAETRYVTDAERQGDGAVFDVRDAGWSLVRGADWRRPAGPNGPEAVPDHPVTQVSWRDADAFCGAYGARLPTEFEWEHAARLGQSADGHVFAQGDDVRRGGRYAANVWQGYFPLEDTGADGFRSTSPVGTFGAAPSGLTDMAGNVWEWTASWYLPYDQRGRPFIARAGTERVHRGGSFLCDPRLCQGFRVTARAHSTPDTPLMHVGFRCVVSSDRSTTALRRVGRVIATALALRETRHATLARPS